MFPLGMMRLKYNKVGILSPFNSEIYVKGTVVNPAYSINEGSLKITPAEPKSSQINGRIRTFSVCFRTL